MERDKNIPLKIENIIKINKSWKNKSMDTPRWEER